MPKKSFFTSSQVYRLVGNGTRKMTDEEKAELKKREPKSRKQNIEDENLLTEAAKTYVKEKVYEKRIGVSINQDRFAKSTEWGNEMEPLAFTLMDMDYVLHSKKRVEHPKLMWSGATDVSRPNEVGDIKCPWTRLSYCQMHEYIEGGLEVLKADKPEYYWQLVSNACLSKVANASLNIYIPKQQELDHIRKELSDTWIATEKVLPFIANDAEIDSFKSLVFKVPPADKKHLEKKIKLAEALYEELIKAE